MGPREALTEANGPLADPVVISEGSFNPDVIIGVNPANDTVDVGKWLGTTVATPTIGGVPEVDLTYIGGDANSLTRLKRSVDAVLVGTVVADGGNNATTFLTDLTTENDDYYGDASGGLVMAFISGTANQHQTRRIIASSTSGGNTSITLEAALDATPAGSDAFITLGRITELS